MCQQSLSDSLGGKFRGAGVDIGSATGQRFTTTGSTQIFMRTRDGVNVSGDLQIAHKTGGLQRSIISVGQMADRGNIIEFRSSGGTIFKEVTDNRIEVERAGDVYRLKAHTSAKSATGTSGTNMLMGFEQEPAGLRKHNPRHRVNQKSNNTLWHIYSFEAGVHTACVSRQRDTTSRVLAAYRSSTQTTCSSTRMERQSLPELVMTG